MSWTSTCCLPRVCDVLQTRAAPRGSQPDFFWSLPRAEASVDGISGEGITSAASSTDGSSIAHAAKQHAWPPSHENVIVAATALLKRTGTHQNPALDVGLLSLKPKKAIDFIASFGSAPPAAVKNLSAMCVHRDGDPVAYVQFSYTGSPGYIPNITAVLLSPIIEGEDKLCMYRALLWELVSQYANVPVEDLTFKIDIIRSPASSVIWHHAARACLAPFVLELEADINQVRTSVEKKRFRVANVNSVCEYIPLDSESLSASRVAIYALAQPLLADRTPTVVDDAADNKLSFLAIENDECVGIVIGVAFGHDIYLQLLAVAPSHFRRGIAKHLLSLCLTAAVNHNASRKTSKVLLHVKRTSEAAIALYASLGFNATTALMGPTASTTSADAIVANYSKLVVVPITPAPAAKASSNGGASSPPAHAPPKRRRQDAEYPPPTPAASLPASAIFTDDRGNQFFSRLQSAMSASLSARPTSPPQCSTFSPLDFDGIRNRDTNINLEFGKTPTAAAAASVATASAEFYGNVAAGNPAGVQPPGTAIVYMSETQSVAVIAALTRAALNGLVVYREIICLICAKLISAKSPV